MEYEFHTSIDNIAAEWSSHVGNSTFLDVPFYKALEASPPSGTSYRYCIVRHDGECIGLLYYQLKLLQLDKSLRLDSAKMADSVKRKLAGLVKYTTLVAGNMTLTGTYGHQLQKVTEEQKWSIMTTAIEKLVQQLKREKISVRGVLMKDYEIANKPLSVPKGYAEFHVQPNMVLNISDQWLSFEDYITAMKSKYRVRVRRARKKASDLVKTELSEAEIYQQRGAISKLYQNVADGAGFNLFTLPDDYFYSMKKNLGNKMKLVAYYRGDVMHGFYTSIVNHKDLDAHFLGYDPVCNKECQLYLNMLYDLVDEAIDMKAEKLVLSRTAMEIKSSIGAVPVEMYLYLKSTGRLVNKMLPKALDYFTPKTDWVARSPFG